MPPSSTPSSSPDASFDAFLDELLRAVHGSNVDATLHAGMRADLLERMNQRLILSLLAELTESEQDAFEALASDPSKHGEIEAFLRARIPRYDDVVVRAMQSFRDDYLSGSGAKA